MCNFLPPSKGYLKIHFEFSFGINIKFFYSNSPQQLIQEITETDPGTLPTSKMELAVTMINGSPIYAKFPVLSRRLPGLSSTYIYHQYYPHYCYPVKSPSLAIILLSLLCLFASKPGKICTCNSICSFLITSSSVVFSEFNHNPFTVVYGQSKTNNI